MYRGIQCDIYTLYNIHDLYCTVRHCVTYIQYSTVRDVCYHMKGLEPE